MCFFSSEGVEEGLDTAMQQHETVANFSQMQPKPSSDAKARNRRHFLTILGRRNYEKPFCGNPGARPALRSLIATLASRFVCKSRNICAQIALKPTCANGNCRQELSHVLHVSAHGALKPTTFAPAILFETRQQRNRDEP